jgi:hypothetical protein
MEPLELLLANARELVEHLEVLATAPAEPGDSAVRYREHREEAIELNNLVGIGLHFMAVPA